MVKQKSMICLAITLVLFLLPMLSSGCTHVSPGKIAFVSDREGTHFIYVMNPDGSNPTKLGSWFGVANTFCWSPDGKRITLLMRMVGSAWFMLMTEVYLN